jgi:transcriptional regulator with XRE-family HTH domain
MQAFSYICQTPLYDSLMQTGRPANKPRTSLGERITAARTDAGLTQQQLADKVETTQRVIAYWEREAVSLRADQIDSLADALNISTDELLGRTSRQRSGGPIGKARQVFEKVSKLPRNQQQRIISVVEALVAQNANAH